MVYIGVDLGGTNIAVGVVSEEGQILAQAETPTLYTRPYQELVKDMADCANKALEKAGYTADDVKAIGIGIPGLADPKDGHVIFCTNLGWHDIPLRAEMQKYFPKPVLIDNDATVAGLAESYAGVSKGRHSSIFITLGTGVGGGIVIDGKPWSGFHGVGSEIGHMTLVADGIPCTCGNDGCLEQYCSATALIRMAKQYCHTYPHCLIMKMAEDDPEKINARIVVDAAKQGDPVAKEIFEKYTRYLAVAINTLTSFFDPEIYVLGGGVSRAGEFLRQAIVEKLPRYQMFKGQPMPEVLLASLGNEAGIIGAAMLGKAV